MTDMNIEDVFAELNITNILVAVLEVQKEITVPTSVLIETGKSDKELRVDYNSDDQTFTFTLKGKDESGNDNN
jgi:hypothetical protein